MLLSKSLDKPVNRSAVPASSCLVAASMAALVAFASYAYRSTSA
jgi:hypothetical protein